MEEEALIIVRSVKSDIMKKQVFEEFVLEQVDLSNVQHELFIKRLMSDRSIQKELFIDKEQFDSVSRTDLLSNNSFIVKVEDIPIGYIETSPISNGNISLSIGIEKTFRGNGYGTLILSGLTDNLLYRDDIDRVSAIISNKNEASIRLFEKCGFERSEDVPNCFIKTKAYKLTY